MVCCWYSARFATTEAKAFLVFCLGQNVFVAMQWGAIGEQRVSCGEVDFTSNDFRKFYQMLHSQAGGACPGTSSAELQLLPRHRDDIENLHLLLGKILQAEGDFGDGGDVFYPLVLATWLRLRCR